MLDIVLMLLVGGPLLSVAFFMVTGLIIADLLGFMLGRPVGQIWIRRLVTDLIIVSAVFMVVMATLLAVLFRFRSLRAELVWRWDSGH